jgi:hypothetical protein
MEMPQTHCYPTVTVTLLWKRHKLIATQQQVARTEQHYRRFCEKFYYVQTPYKTSVTGTNINLAI